jgi:hypothetical protein
MMQLDGRYLLNLCSESEGTGEAAVIQTRMQAAKQKILLVNIIKN